MSEKARVWARLIASFVMGLVPMVIDKLSTEGEITARAWIIFLFVLLLQATGIFTAWMTKTFDDAKVDQARIDIENDKIVQDIKVERKDAGLPPVVEVKP